MSLHCSHGTGKTTSPSGQSKAGRGIVGTGEEGGTGEGGGVRGAQRTARYESAVRSERSRLCSLVSLYLLLFSLFFWKTPLPQDTRAGAFSFCVHRTPLPSQR